MDKAAKIILLLFVFSFNHCAKENPQSADTILQHAVICTEVGYYDTPGNARGITADSNIIYIADDQGGFRIIDVSDPSNPAEVYAYSQAYAFEIDINGNLACVAYGDSGLYIFDISNPSSSYVIGRVKMQEAVINVVSRDTIVYLACPTRIYAINIKDPAQPIEIGHIDIAGITYSIAVEDTILFAANGDQGLKIISIADPESTIEISGYNSTTMVMDVLAKDQHILISDRGVDMVNVNDPQNPFSTGKYSMTGYSFGIAENNNRVLVTADIAGLRVLDIVNQTDLIEVGTFDTPGEAKDVCAIGNYAYVADGSKGLRVIFIKDK